MKVGITTDTAAVLEDSGQDLCQSNEKITMMQEDISAIKEQMENQCNEHRETQTKLTSLHDDVIKNNENE